MKDKEIGFELKGWKFFVALGIFDLFFFIWDGVLILLALGFGTLGLGILSWFYDIEVAGIMRRRKKWGEV